MLTFAAVSKEEENKKTSEGHFSSNRRAKSINQNFGGSVIENSEIRASGTESLNVFSRTKNDNSAFSAYENTQQKAMRTTQHFYVGKKKMPQSVTGPGKVNVTAIND